MATFDLLIVGCGPVGAVAGNLAGAAGLSTVIIDRREQVFDLPRAIHLDGHVMRILQQAGAADTLLPETRVWKRSTFYGADGEPIRVHEWPPERSQGWDAHYLFYQPTLEQILRARIRTRDNVTLQLGREVRGIEQRENEVAVWVQQPESGATEELTARYVLAADGASSFARASVGIGLIDQNFDEPWMVIDLICSRELGRPDESEMFCDPRRPATRVPGPHRHHRWEFMLLPGETPEEIQRPDSVQALLAPWVTMDEVQILRASVYRFHALVAERWRAGRLFLVGDAAHQTPVFLGQGLCHGIRDVQNVIWKLAAVRAGAPERELLDSYEAERRPHVETIIEMSVAAGRDICLLDPVAAADRDARMRAEAASGRLPRTTFQGMPVLRGGLFTRPGAGELFPQPSVRRADGRTGLMDDVVGARPALVVPGAAPKLSSSAEDAGAVMVTVDDGGGGICLTEPAELKRWMSDRGASIAVVRPDRYVHALTNDPEEATQSLRELGELITARAPARS